MKKATIEEVQSRSLRKNYVKNQRAKGGKNQLPNKEFVRLMQWLAEMDWQRWDEPIKTDVKAGRLDLLVREAIEEIANGSLR